MQKPFNPTTLRVLTAAGWTERRDRPDDLDLWEKKLSLGFALFSSAADALRRFGGIQVTRRAPGAGWALRSFHLDPVLALDEEDRFEEFGELLGARLYPLGELDDGHAFLAIDEAGRVYALMLDVWLLGDSIDDAIEALVTGDATTPQTRLGSIPENVGDWVTADRA